MIILYIICIHKQSTSALHLGASHPAAQMQKKETYPQTQNKYGGMRVPELKKALEGRGAAKVGKQARAYSGICVYTYTELIQERHAADADMIVL